LIKNGKVVDGTGSPWFKGDVAISTGKITQVGKLDPKDYDMVIDADGLVVSPGIIDIHSHSDYSLLVNPEADSFIRQGITTVFNGNCGGSAAPLNESAREFFEERRGVSIDWLSTAEYLSTMESRGVAINSATFTGLGNLLVSAMGMDAYDRPPTDEELEQMKRMLKQAMDEGSYGLSSGLEYDPQTLIDTDALVELCRIVAGYGGIYATHIRSRDVKVVEAAKEAAEIGERSGVIVEGVHWGARYPSDGKTKHIVDLFDAARERGLDVGFNQVPWTMDENGVGWCGCGLIEPIIIGSKYIKKGAEFTYEMLKDPEVIEYLRGDLPNRQYGPILAGTRGLLDTWDRFLVAHLENSPEYNGMNLKQIGQEMGKAPRGRGGPWGSPAGGTQTSLCCIPTAPSPSTRGTTRPEAPSPWSPSVRPRLGPTASTPTSSRNGSGRTAPSASRKPCVNAPVYQPRGCESWTGASSGRGNAQT